MAAAAPKQHGAVPGAVLSPKDLVSLGFQVRPGGMVEDLPSPTV